MSIGSLRNVASYPAIVGQVLSNLRKNINVDQSEFAEIIGVTQSTWSRIERGSSAFTIEQLADAADHLKKQRATGQSNGSSLVIYSYLKA